MLALRHGVVAGVRPDPGPGPGPEQSLLVDLDDGRHPAIADTVLVGRCQPGDEVIVNVAARELGLGSGGFDLVHVNLTRGLGGGRPGPAAVMKLNYLSLQHAVRPLEPDGRSSLPAGAPVAVIALHGQLAPLVWALGRARPGVRVGYVQTAGGALSGSRSKVARELRRRRLLAAHVTAGACFGGPDGEAMTTIGAIDHGRHEWDVVVCGPGPGIIGSASTLGHGGMAALDSAHAALSLGAATTVVPRMSQADPRERHRGISHHSRTVLELLLAPVTVPLPPGVAVPAWGAQHHWRTVAAPDLAGYAASGLPATTMGRSLAEDPLFFAAPLAAGGLVGDPSDLP